MCNLLFVSILNKHKFVTRYVFYISVCMFSAYLESSIVAVFYFALTSEGSLNNLKLYNCPSHCGHWPFFEGEFQYFQAHCMETQ